jgi:NIMA (never in mitosis gene a)-related kinase
VIKQINLAQLSASEKEGAVQEVKLLSELHHPFIVAYRESFLEGEVLCIVMQYCDGGDLTTLIKLQDGQFFPEEQILDWFIQLCLALRYIHQRRIIHRDLKCQ